MYASCHIHTLSLLVLQVLGSFVGGLPTDSLPPQGSSQLFSWPCDEPLLKESDKPNVCPMALRAGGRKPGKPKEETKKKGEVWWLPPLNPEGKIQINTDTKLDCGFPFHILMSTER